MATISPGEPIAVIGSGCRFPGGINTPSKLWEQLQSPTDLQRPIPKDRFNMDAFYHQDGTHPGRTSAVHAYTLSANTHAFDASFFNIQPHEAEAIDPQQRILLETVYEGITSAGLQVETLAGSSTAVYVGVMTHDFETNITRDLSSVPTHTATGISLCIASNRVSYFFDWHGPSYGSQSPEQPANIINLSNLRLVPFVLESKLNMLSPTGRCRMWDAAADGYARGEGVACIVLKTLSKALTDGDNIECIIRETGINQDGRTPGITMPNSTAQAALIRDTYRRAGLDLKRATDRCQFFEAHGTGTPAGDPREAEAISTAFFGRTQQQQEDDGNDDEDPLLYVGSVKTVIGHTEGTAGIAGLLKASLAVQHGIIPPNLLFDNLNPSIAPYYRHLRILNKARPWPDLPPGAPRRASVNSFGFGGTNAHAIIESYPPASTDANCLVAQQKTSTPSPVDVLPIPLVLSAKSERSLKALMQDLADFLRANRGTVSVQDVARTLFHNRSVLSVRRAVVIPSGGSGDDTVHVDAACAALEGEMAAISAKQAAYVVNSDLKSKPGILGIFTGQGAQWPSMGRRLISAIPLARETLLELDASLQTLPVEFRPGWTLHDEMMKSEADGSNVMNAAYSQPLCTAVQVILVRLLAAVGITFSAVVGHSSGEIACAYAAGFITASHAIRIAHLRGVVAARYAASPTGARGAMLAAGTSYEDGLTLCELDAFRGRICVAASNAEDSVTFSGDEDAVREMEEVLKDESKFTRLLKVDKAYHSHHMLPCAPHYMQAMKACGYSDVGNDVPSSSPSSTVWYSSVLNGKVLDPTDINSDYWKDNLISPVLFSQALGQAVQDNVARLDVAVEIGPHPALTGPALSTMQASAGVKLPYTGCMQRGGDDIDAFAGALGYLWERFGSGCINTAALLTNRPATQRTGNLAKQLPQYPWDYSRLYWAASRRAKAFLHGERPHLLLGKLSADSTAASLVWNNAIRPRDIEWLDGHGLQGQTVFPGAGYVIMAMEGALHVVSNKKVSLLEVLDLRINKAITFEDETRSVELCLRVDIIAEDSDPGRIVLQFNIDSCLAKESNPSSSASGHIVVTLTPEEGEGNESTCGHALPPAQLEPPHMNKVNLDTFYKELASIGYQYDKEFRDIHSMRRVDGKTTGTMGFPRCPDGEGSILLHPATLDLSFQTVIGAYSSPGDKRLRSLHVPTGIERVALDPSLCASLYSQGLGEVCFNSSIRTFSSSEGIGGDIEVFVPASHINDASSSANQNTNNDKRTLFQVDGIVFKPFTLPSAADDHRMFSKWAWGPLVPETVLDNEGYWATEQDKTAAATMERAVFFYIRGFLGRLTENDRLHASSFHQQQIKWFEHVMLEVREGRLHAWYEPSWEVDTQADIARICQQYPNHPHVRLIQRIGDSLSDIILYGTRDPFQLMEHDGLLTEFYTTPCSFGPSLLYFRDLVACIAHRHQRMNILEIGGGTGGATRHILDLPQFAFGTYTFTDISSGFLDRAREEFSQLWPGHHENHDRMEFRTLDIRRSPEEQGFQLHQYDLIVASNVLHATPSLRETMENVRSLLKPGGHVAVMELTHREHARLGFLFGLFPDWWAGVDDGRTWEPFVSLEGWDDVLKKTGFSGVDSRTLDRDAAIFPNSCFSTHAVNALVSRLDDPLSAIVTPKQSNNSEIVVIGGDSLWTKAAISGLREKLPHRQFTVVKRLEDLHETTALQLESTFIILSELEGEATFEALDIEKFEAVKLILHHAAYVLWVTENAWDKHPYQAMAIGLLRSVRLEQPSVSIQVLDADNLADLSAELLAKQVVRLESGTNWKEDGLVWTQEPEIYLRGGRLMIPRLKHDVERNDRLNSGRRPILTDVEVTSRPVVLRRANGETYLECGDIITGGNSEAGTSLVEISVDYSMAKSIRVANLGSFYLVQGTDVSSGRAVVALSSDNASRVTVAASRVFPLNLSSDDCNDGQLILPIEAEILARTMTAQAAPSSGILVLEPPQFLVKPLIRAAKRVGLALHLASVHDQGASAEATPAASWIRLHKKETHASLAAKAVIPGISVLYDFSDDQGIFSLGKRLAACLSSTCLIYSSDYLAQDEATQTLTSQQDTIQQRQLVEEAIATAALTTPDLGTVIAADLVSSFAGPWEISTVINWQAAKALKARLRPLDSGALFVPTKTYLLVGLAGDLGRSLARWMLRHGARHLVLSSRNPQVDARWLQETRDTLGGNVLVLPMDVSDRSSVATGLAKIAESGMPATIGGVAFGPLVLQDILFKNMDLEMMEMVAAPKVDGARILNEALEDQPLDFFVMFSSVVAVLGNPGQSAYSAANSYMHGLAQQRRARGLSGSTIDIGAVYGVGYVTRAGREEEFDAVRFLFDTVSEDELHALFAEAVVAGRPEAPRTQDIEIITGVPFIDPVHQDRIPFFDDPRFGYYMLQIQNANGDHSAASVGSVKERLMTADSISAVREIIIDGLCTKLRSTLQIDSEDSIDITRPLIDQGVDSLGAVTIGTWFSKQLNLHLPLLKILGGASITDLATEAADRLPSATIPLVQSGSSPDEDDVSSGRLAISAGDGSKSGTSTEADSGTETPPSDLDSLDEDGNYTKDPIMIRQEQLSLAQERSWTLHQQAEDPTMFNSTIGMFLKGSIDLVRLSRAVDTTLRRHDIFRTRFDVDPSNSNRVQQAIMSLPSPQVRLRVESVADEAAAEAGFERLQRHRYDISAGDTMKLVVFSWSDTDHLLVLGYSRFVGDGQTTENLFNELGQLYAGAKLPPPAQQYADFTSRQRRDYESGHFDRDLEFWASLHAGPVSAMPVLKLPDARPRSPVPSNAGKSGVWEQHAVSVRLSPMIAIRVKERSRKHKASPLHFYLTAFHVLLARLAGNTDKVAVVGVADTNRPSLQDIATMGYFANLLPLRMSYSAADTFSEELVAAKEHMRAALQHSQVPHGILLDKLGMSATAPNFAGASDAVNEPAAAAPAPLFQAVFDYRQGQAESGSLGDAKITSVLAYRERTPYDVVLEISDDPTRTPLITFKLQRSIYSLQDAQRIANSYVSVLSVFSRNPALKVNDGRL